MFVQNNTELSTAVDGLSC